jgi:hypothetical protein
MGRASRSSARPAATIQGGRQMLSQYPVDVNLLATDLDAAKAF